MKVCINFLLGIFSTMVRVVVHESRRVGLILAYTLLINFLITIILLMGVLFGKLSVLLKYLL